MDRTKFIGSSEAAAVMGLSRWDSPLSIWAKKVGEVEPKDLSEVEAVEWGVRLERLVSAKFSEKNGVKLMAYKNRYTHPEYPFLQCELDNIIVGTDEMVEIKTCNAWKAKEWEGEEIPREYIIQVMFALGVSGRKVGHIAVLIGGQKYVEKKIEFDQEFFDTMVAQCVAFWDLVQKREQPMAIGLDNSILSEIYPESDDQIQQLQEFEDKIALRQELSMHIKEMKKEQEDIDASIKQRIGESLGFKTGKYVVKWAPSQRASVDADKLREAGLFDQYAKVSKFRVLRISKNNRKKDK